MNINFPCINEKEWMKIGFGRMEELKWAWDE
jgi:hypothetical protein